MQIQGSYQPPGSTRYSSAAAEEAAQVKASPGMLMGFEVTNFNGALRYLYVFDNASASSGTLLCPPIPLQLLGAVGSRVEVYLPYFIPFALGLRFASSSTGATFTASATADLRVAALFK